MKKVKGLKKESQNTVISLINILEEKNCKPVVARNYEDFPNFDNDLDLFVENDSLIPNYFCSVAEELGWDNLAFCNHYSFFKNEIYNINSYRFLRLDHPQTLNVDLFGGFVLLGLPFRDKSSICKNRILEPKGRFYKMEPVWENGYRLFQIESLITKKNKDKIERYRKKILNFNSFNPKKLESWGKKYNLGDLRQAIEALHLSDMILFKKKIRRAKLRFFLNEIFEKPLLSISNLIDRRIGLNKQFNLDPCGPFLNLPSKSESLLKKLDQLVDNQFLPGWSEIEDLRERGWAFVNFSEENKNHFEFNELVNLLVNRHKVLYYSKNFEKIFF